MGEFVLRLRSATRTEEVAGVTSFVGEDASGQFGVQARHARLMTALVTGLARFRVAAGPWEYLALPGGVLYFAENTLAINTRLYLRDADYERITRGLHELIEAEEEHLRTMKQSLLRLEQEMLRRLSELARGSEGLS